jgi:hypothetical protein
MSSVRIPPGPWRFVCCECCVLSGRGLCDGLITRPEESYRLWRVVVCDQETSKNEEAKAHYRAVENTTRWVVTPRKQTNKQTTLWCKSGSHRLIQCNTLQWPKVSYKRTESFCKTAGLRSATRCDLVDWSHRFWGIKICCLHLYFRRFAGGGKLWLW